MAPRAAGRLAAAATCLVLAALSVAHVLRDEAGRRPLREFARRFDLDRRRPLDVATIALAPADDLAAGVLANAALRDAIDPVSLDGLTPPMRRAWLQALEERDAELDAARRLARDGLARRPGWAYHAFLLAALTYLADARRADSPADVSRWEAPLRLAATEAPRDDAIWTFWAGTYLDRGPAALAGGDGRFREVLGRAFRDAGFVSRVLPAAVAALGRPSALACVPDAVAPLRAAVQVLSGEKDLEGAAAALARLEGAERTARAAELGRIEERARRGDDRGLAAACARFAREHPASERDDAKGRAETARVLALWPEDRLGEWWTDPRGEVIRFFLEGRQESVPGEVLARAASALAGAPDHVLARLSLGAGDEVGARSIARGSPSAGSFEWTRFFVELAEVELRAGRTAEAEAALSQIAPAAREGCDVLLERRRLARALRDDAGARRLSEALASLSPPSHPPEAWSAGGSLSLCVDPESAAARSLVVTVEAKEPVLVAYGWDGGRSGTLLVPASGARLALPLSGLEGRHTLSVRPTSGRAPVLSASVLGE